MSEDHKSVDWVGWFALTWLSLVVLVTVGAIIHSLIINSDFRWFMLSVIVIGYFLAFVQK